MTTTQPTAKVHYVDNAKFYEACKVYKQQCDTAKEAGLPRPKINDYIGDCLLKIATKLSYSRNFINYSYREEMIGDGIENCILYFHNFNPDKYKNPFSYFTQIIYYAFLRRIDREKKQKYVKHKVMMNQIDEGLMDLQDFDSGDDFGVNIDDKVTNNEFMNDFVTAFEKRTKARHEQRSAGRKRKKAEEEALEPFFEQPEVEDIEISNVDIDE
jgi:hypothetical protein